MSNARLRDLAMLAGIELGYCDTWGNEHEVSDSTLHALLRTMGFATDSPHELELAIARVDVLAPEGVHANQTIERAWRPASLQGDGRRWGLSVQLYGLRSARDWGIGDFSGLSDLMRGAAALGASAVGVNPLHALFPTRPEHASPYSPSSRRFINPLYLDVETIQDFVECDAARERVEDEEFQAQLRRVRVSDRVQYRAVASLKYSVLAIIYEYFRRSCLDSVEHPRGRLFRRFQVEQGLDLRRFAVFHALLECDSEMDWRKWPAEFSDPDSDAVTVFAKSHIERVEFHEYLQWQAALQLQEVNRIATACGMGIGLYADLAVGADPTGAEAWSAQDFLIRGATIGAPPDQMNLSGQNWGLPPPDPLALRNGGYARIAALLDSNMRHAGALRIDHILGLMRLYWIPEGASAEQGAYVRYPWRHLFGLVATRSQDNHCLVIGEDLGTVPTGLREAMHATGFLSYRLLYFEQCAGGFRAPHDYPVDALVAAGTHDLPPLPMWWDGEDIELREKLGLWPTDEMREAEMRDRALARDALSRALRQAGVLAADGIPAETPVEAVYAYLARTPCKLLMVQLEDVLDQHSQINVPGTTDQYPNWRQRLPCSVADALAHPRMLSIADLLREAQRSDAGP